MKVIHWRKRSVMRLILFLILWALIGYGVFYVRRAYKDFQCSDHMSRRMLSDLCHLYIQNKVAGNLCADLCTDRSITFQKCINYRHGKKIFIAEWQGKTIILKSKQGFIEEYDKAWYQHEGEEEIHYPDLQEFAMKINRVFEERIGIKLHSQYIEESFDKIWSFKFEDFFENPTRPFAKEAGMDSINSLLQQDEYVIMKYFQGSQHFPNIYGTCGHFYAMEYVPSGGVLDPNIFSLRDASSWNQRRLIAMKLLDLVKAFEQTFHQPLHLCDIKNENFGITSTDDLKAIDVDMAYFDNRLKDVMADENCTKHSNCDFFDCKGWCDLKTNECTERRINNNLQVVCQDIFIHHSGNAFRGLLRNPPWRYKARFDKVLDECSNPLNIQDEHIRLRTPDTTFWKLYNLLIESHTDIYSPPAQPLSVHDHEH